MSAPPAGPFSVVLNWDGAELRVRGRRQPGAYDLEVFEVVDAVTGAPLVAEAVGVLCAHDPFLRVVLAAVVEAAK